MSPPTGLLFATGGPEEAVPVKIAAAGGPVGLRGVGAALRPSGPEEGAAGAGQRKPMAAPWGTHGARLRGG
jgi:hypothetical protein